MPEKLTVEEFPAYLRPFYPTWDTELEKSILSTSKQNAAGSSPAGRAISWN